MAVPAKSAACIFMHVDVMLMSEASMMHTVRVKVGDVVEVGLQLGGGLRGLASHIHGDLGKVRQGEGKGKAR